MLRSRLKAHVTTPDLTYRAHMFQVEEFTDTKDRVTILDGDQVVATMTDAEVTTRDGDVWRAEGLVNGQRVVWRSLRACGRCGGKTAYPTPSYEIPR